MNNFFPDTVKNDNIKNRLSSDIANNSISHAYIFEGNSGSGRHMTARYLAAALECKNRENAPCKSCTACNKIFSKISPDVIEIGLEGEKASIGVDAVRFIKNDIYIPPNDLEIKMYIINDADKMTLQAQNAFLLSLEEPPPYVIFILICENSSLLLETIKSRAPIYRTDKLNSDDIKDYLLNNSNDARELYKESSFEFSEILCASNGSIGQALSLLDPKERKKVLSTRAVAREFLNLSLERSKAKVFDMISSLGSKRPDIIAKLELIKLAIRDLTLLKRSDNAELCFYGNFDEACELSVRFPLEKLLSMYESITQAIDALYRNANVRLTLMCMMYTAGLL